MCKVVKLLSTHLSVNNLNMLAHTIGECGSTKSRGAIIYLDSEVRSGKTLLIILCPCNGTS